MEQTYHNNKTEIGRLGEDFATKKLQEMGLYLVARNFKTSGGEIDIIALDGEEIAFVEVKTRAEGHLISGLDAVTKKKQKAIIRAARSYLEKNTPDYYPRFDVMEVIVQKKPDVQVIAWKHWKAAFWEE